MTMENTQHSSVGSGVGRRGAPLNDALGSVAEFVVMRLRAIITADTITLALAVTLTLSLFAGWWFRATRVVGLNGWDLVTGGGNPAAWETATLYGGARLVLWAFPLIGAACVGLALAGLIRPALRTRFVPLIAAGGIGGVMASAVYLFSLAVSPQYNRYLDAGLWFALVLSIALVLQLFFQRSGVEIPRTLRLRTVGITSVVLAVVYVVTFWSQFARSREGDSVAFELTAMVGLALYGAIIGGHITGVVYRRKGLNPRAGLLAGLWIGAFGHLALLVPLWLYAPTTDQAPRQRLKIDEVVWGALLLAPWLVSFILLTVYPMLDSYRVALYNWQGFGEPTQFVGLRHVENVIRDPFFWRSLGNTVTYTVVLVPIQLSLSLILAIVLTRKSMRFATLYRTIYFLPAVTSVAVVAVVMRLLLGNFGTEISRFFGANPPIDPISHPQWALITVIIFGMWHSFGVNLVYFMAALQTVPEELYDAAQVDGANWFEQLIHVTLPSIRPIAIIILFMAFIGSMYVFEQSFVLTRGGPYFASQVVTGYIYNYAFSQPGTQIRPNFGYASSAALFFALIMLVLTITNYVVTNRMRKAAAS